MAHSTQTRITAAGRILSAVAFTSTLLIVAAPPVVAAGGPSETIITSVAGGLSHTCAITSDGALKCWGRNDSGQLGDNSTTQRTVPTDVPLLASGVVALAAGDNHSCALTTAGGIKCWGLNNPNGQLGDNTTADKDEPADVFGLTSGVAAIGAGANHTCAVTTSGAVKCWGANDSGQLGIDVATTQSSAPVDVTGLASGVVAVEGGLAFSCALTSAGGVKCWGSNLSGQLGVDKFTLPFSATPLDIGGLTSGVAAIALGQNFGCALTTTGGVKCWGLNSFGQLGDNQASSDSFVPVTPIGLGGGVTAIAAGERFACAVLSTGAMKCWGLNGDGQLGDNSLDMRLTPVDVTNLATEMAFVAAGGSHTCAISTYGALRCWGRNTNGQLGLAPGNTASIDQPQAVNGLAINRLAALASGWNHTCAIDNGGGVKCWGSNSSGQVGDASGTNRFQAVDVSGLSSGIAMMDGGRLHTCAVTSTGGVKCWGEGGEGQLGDGFLADRLVPVDVVSVPPPPDPAPAFTGAAAVATGRSHSCLLTTGGGVKCWGFNSTYGLGDVAGSVQHTTPTDVSGLTSGVAAIAMHAETTCAVMIGTGLKCWGNNDTGQVGDGTGAPRFTPTNVSGYAAVNVQQVVVGETHGCALAGGGVKCWGSNHRGQLGDNSTTLRFSPVDVTGLTSGVAAIAAGSFHTCAVLTSGAVKCWGANNAGQVGDGSTTTDRIVPTDVAGLTSGVASVVAGENHTCAFTTAGEVKCWGSNLSGQWGVGSSFATDVTPHSARIGPQRITLAPDATIPFGTSYPIPFSVATGGTSSLALTFGDTWTPGTCAVGGGSVTPAALGLCGIRISSNPHPNYAAAPQALRLIEIVKGDQAISFAALPNVLSTSAPFVVSATGGASGNNVTFSSTTPAVCGAGAPTTATSATVTLTGMPGACTIAANQAGNANFNAAPQVAQTFVALYRTNVVLEGAQEVPVNGSPATGTGTVDVNLVDNTLTYAFSFSGLTGPVTMAHFHGPGARGVTAGVKVDITANQTSGVASYGSVPQDEDDIFQSKWYVNFHTATYPNGEIRGQLDNVGAAARRTLTVTKAGTGGGTVASGVLEPGIDCGATCNFSYPQGLQVTLTATPDGSSIFAGWSGSGCSGTGTCTVTLNSAGSVTATFDPIDTTPDAFAFTDVINASRSTTQTSNFVTITGINAPAQVSVIGGEYSIGCTASFTSSIGSISSGQTVCVRHTSSSSGNSLTNTTLTVGGASDTFTSTTKPTFTLTAATAGNGTGTVTGTGITCPGDCSEVVDTNTMVMLAAAPGTGSAFTGWSGGGCSGTAPCPVTVIADTTVTATFTLNQYTVTPSAGSNGAISPNTAQTVNHGATAAFTVTPNAGYTAVVNGTCGGNLVGNTYTTNAITANCTVSATFTQVTYTVTPSAGANGALSPSTPQTVGHGATTSFTVTPASGFEIDAVSGCGGALAGSTYTTGAITANCTVTASFKSANPPRMVNIATRMRVLTGDDVMIAGFIIGGSAPKTVVVRARGPSLAQAGVPGVLANPMLQLFQGQTQLAVNDDWGQAANASAVQAAGFHPSDASESAIMTTLSPGAYTAIVTGVGGTMGVSIVEVFEVDGPAIPLINIATRGRVQTGDDVMIGGFIIQGDGPQTVVIRARGPSLAQAGVPGVLANPMLQLYTGQTQLAVNDNWADAANAAQVQASGFAPSDPAESAILVTLNPGAFTAIVTGVGGTTGVAIMEVFRN